MGGVVRVWEELLGCGLSGSLHVIRPHLVFTVLQKRTFVI